MKILYVSCHEILEFDELTLFKELGYEFFSPMGAYYTLSGGALRPRLENPTHPKQFEEICTKLLVNDPFGEATRANLPQEMIDWADVVIFMHKPEWVRSNWGKVRHKKVVLRTIGQMVPAQERDMKPLVDQGLKILRYSPAERRIPDFAGEAGLIRFYKDPEEFKGWTGEIEKVLTFNQSIKQRGDHCHYEDYEKVTKDLPRSLYGPGNEVLPYSPGALTYDQQKEALRQHRVYMYTHTEPASYTLNFIEALMTGIPTVSFGPFIADQIYTTHAYEIPEIIQHGVNGFVSDVESTLQESLNFMLKNPEAAKQIGEAGRRTAIELFGKETIKEQWREFLEHLS